MTDIDPATRRAARALGERLASAARDDSPRRASFTDVGTIEEVMADGTALVSYRGGTIGPLPMTTDCVCAARGRSCVIAIDGPIVRVIGIIARSSTDFELPASTITGTLGVSHGGTGATTAAGARSSLGVEQSPLLVNGSFHGTGHKYFLIAKSSLPTNDNAGAGYVRVRADFGGWTAPTRTTVDVTVHLRSLEVSVAQCVSPASRKSLLQVKQDPSGYVWVYLWMSEEYYYASVRVDGEQFERLGTWGSEPSGDVKWTSSMYQSYVWSKRLYAGATVGSGLEFHDGTLSVDNGAYVNLYKDSANNGYCAYRRSGGLVCVVCDYVSSTAKTNKKLGTLPAGCRPARTVLGMAYPRGANSCGQITVDPDGKVSLYTFEGSSGYVGGSVTFPLP